MKIRLLYFARLREQLKTEAEMLHLDDEQVLLADVLNALRARGGVWQESLAAGQALAFAVGKNLPMKKRRSKTMMRLPSSRRLPAVSFICRERRGIS